jgi:regulator of protease activity HflC (stomatin/prohibitin superfamily)
MICYILILNENERAFLFKNGVYKRMLMPGKHRIWSCVGETIIRVNINVPISLNPKNNVGEMGLLKRTLFADKAFMAATTHIEVSDGFIAVHKEDGRIIRVLHPGLHCFWNICEHEFIMIDVTQCEITQFPPEQLRSLPATDVGCYRTSDGEVGILLMDGKFLKSFSGTFHFWLDSWVHTQHLSCRRVDMRLQRLEVSGQEILTADKVSLRINFVCNYKVVDAVKAVTEMSDYQSSVYTTIQLILREYIGRFKFDDLLEQKESIAAHVLEQLCKKQDSLFVEFKDAGLKDIILPGEIREIMNTVLVAEKNAQANVIARREEVASTRSLLNTAKLMDENATLYKLKELEYLEKICDKVGSISVGGGNILSELRNILSSEHCKNTDN